MKYLLILLVGLSLVEPAINFLLGEDTSKGRAPSLPDGVSDWSQLTPQQEATLLAQIKSQMGPKDTLQVERNPSGRIRSVTVCRT